jgi:pyruvate carboxylase subunit B
VEKDQGLLVIEAMKMENEIRAATAGKVKEVRVAPGQTVESKELLIELE